MSNYDRDAWLKSLKAGDKVANRVTLHSSWGYVNYYSYTYEILEVKSITPKGSIRLTNGILLSPKGTYHKYETWSYSTHYDIEPVTQAILDTIANVNKHKEQQSLLGNNLDKAVTLNSRGKLDTEALLKLNKLLSEVLKDVSDEK